MGEKQPQKDIHCTDHLGSCQPDGESYFKPREVRTWLADSREAETILWWDMRPVNHFLLPEEQGLM